MTERPIVFQWQGDAMVPATRFWQAECDKRFVVGENVTLEEIHARSHATHAHYFAVLKQIWDTLPDHLRPQFGNPEILRKHALIRTGYHTMVQHACKSAAEAERLATVIRPYDAYQIATVEGSVVTVYHAVSQDMRSMNKATFQASKEAVLNWCAELVGADPADVRAAA
ncbi:hypothetical protein [Parvibaculum sp.]|uniref:hypothetical protein n=1 Tax=Parvibaculum sp. TaxID=2024848 RepID=UPI003C712772